jgi:hypothetical protein
MHPVDALLGHATVEDADELDFRGRLLQQLDDRAADRAEPGERDPAAPVWLERH